MVATSFENGILILYKNITQRKKLEYQLKMKEQQYRTIFEKAPVGMMLKDQNGKILRINKEACKISGFDKESLENNMNKDKLNSSQSYKNKQVNNLLKTLNVKSSETKDHVMRVEMIVKKFGEYLNLDYQKINELMLLAKLHDIGKVFISESIL